MDYKAFEPVELKQSFAHNCSQTIWLCWFLVIGEHVNQDLNMSFQMSLLLEADSGIILTYEIMEFDTGDL